MNNLLATAALGLALSLSSAPVFADQQRTGAEADDALNWAAVGGRQWRHQQSLVHRTEARAFLSGGTQAP